MQVKLSEMVLALDDAAGDCVEWLKKLGAVNPQVWDHNGYRVVASLDPIGGQLLWHVSVSRDGKSVNQAVSKEYARAIAPHVARWECTVSQIATHVWAE